MKKTYIAPALLIVRVATGCQICTGSPSKTNPTNLDGVTEYSTDTPKTFSRRRHRNDWDDEEEEEW